MRHVFPTNEIPHLWAHQTQSDARNPQGNLYFKDATIYSYRDSWPLARIFTGKRAEGRPLVLTSCNRASVTTDRHQHTVNKACSHLPSVAVPQVEPLEDSDHKANLAYFQTEIKRLLDESTRVLSVLAVRWRHEKALARDENARLYSKFFGIRRKVPDFPFAEFNVAEERARRIETPDPVKDVKKIRDRERRAATFEKQLTEYRAKLAEMITPDAAAFWRAGGHFLSNEPEWWSMAPLAVRKELSGSRRGYWPGIRPRHVLLRVNGDQIETSQGARIPVEHAARIWALVQACHTSEREYVHNGHSEHAGNYRIDSVSAEGELRVGCHVVPFAEMELLARKLDLEFTAEGKRA